MPATVEEGTNQAIETPEIFIRQFRVSEEVWLICISCANSWINLLKLVL